MRRTKIWPDYVPAKIPCSAGKKDKPCQRWATVRSGKTSTPLCFSHGG